jgi:oxalate decarboxylase/phosphoglucose isomerase-like protein (cupin superfamily)
VTDWFIHTPPEILAENFGVPAETFSKIPLHNLWIFQGEVPADGHYVKNVGDTDLLYLEVFRSPYYADVSLTDWLTHTPPEMVAQTLNIAKAAIAKFPNNRPLVMPE